MKSKSSSLKTYLFTSVVLLGIGILILLFLKNNGRERPEAKLPSLSIPKISKEKNTPNKTPENPGRTRFAPRIGKILGTPSLETFLIRGKVRDQDGKALLALVAVFQSGKKSGEEPEGPLVQGKTKKDGTFALHFQVKEAKKLDILALSPSYCPGWKKGLSLVPPPKEIEFVLTRGKAIAGRIRTLSGNPLPGIPVLACPAPSTSRVRAFVSSSMLERGFEQTPYLWKKGYHQASAVTDDDGRFQIQGLKEGKYAILLKSYEWILDPPIRVQSGADNVDGIAKKALFLKARVLDAETSRPVAFLPFDIQIEDPKEGRKFEIGGALLNGILQVGWLPKWHLSKNPFPVTVSLFSPDYFQHRETLFLGETQGGPPPTILVKPIHRYPVLFKAVYKDGEPLGYPVLMVDFWKPGKKPPMGRAEARLVRKGLYQVRLPEGKNRIRVFRPKMKLQWLRKSWPSGEWIVPSNKTYVAVFSKGATLHLHISPETMATLVKGSIVLWMEGTRKKNGQMEFGSQILPEKFKDKTLTIREVPPGVYIRFALKKSPENDRILRASRLLWVDEGGELDFFLK